MPRFARRLALVLLIVAFVGGSVPVSAPAATTPETSVTDAIGAAAGIEAGCATALVSGIDATWATASADDLCYTDPLKVLHQDAATGAWGITTTMEGIGACPVALVPDRVALDLRICTITGPVALPIALDAVKARYPSYSRASRTWIRCPKQEIVDGLEEGDPQYAICRFEFGSKSRVTHGSMRVSPEFAALTRFDTRLTYKKAPRRCAVPKQTKPDSRRVYVTNQSLRASGSFACNQVLKGADPMSDIRDAARRKYPKHLGRSMTVSLHGTNLAGFEDHARFRCAISRSGHGYAASCRNTLADSFRYAFKVVQKPKPKPPSGGGGGSGCHPSYTGACLKQGIGDYDCEGGSGNGPNYTGPVTVVGPDEFDLDRDGDGSACED